MYICIYIFICGITEPAPYPSRRICAAATRLVGMNSCSMLLCKCCTAPEQLLMVTIRSCSGAVHRSVHSGAVHTSSVRTDRVHCQRERRQQGVRAQFLTPMLPPSRDNTAVAPTAASACLPA